MKAQAPRMVVPLRVRIHRAIRCLRAARRAREARSGPRRDQMDLRALDALAAAEKLPRHLEAKRTRLAGVVAATGLRRLPVFARPRSMFPREAR